MKYSYGELVRVGLDIEAVRTADFSGRDWYTGQWLRGVVVHSDLGVVVCEEAVNVNVQLLFLVLNSAVPVITARDLLRVVDGSEGVVYDTDWGSMHPGFREALRNGVIPFWKQFAKSETDRNTDRQQ